MVTGIGKTLVCWRTDSDLQFKWIGLGQRLSFKLIPSFSTDEFQISSEIIFGTRTQITNFKQKRAKFKINGHF